MPPYPIEAGSFDTAFTTAAVPGQRLDRAAEVRIAEHMLLEEHVRSGIVLAAVRDDRRIRAADIAPVGDLSGINALELGR